MGAARVDAALECLLLAVLLPAPGSTDPIFQPDRPLGSFGARSSLAARLGLIERAMERALHTLRRVRSAFVPSSDSASLSDPAYAERLAQANRDARVNPLWASLETLLSKAGGAADPAQLSSASTKIAIRHFWITFTKMTTTKNLRPPSPPFNA